MGPSFKEKVAEFRTCGSREQCMQPTQKKMLLLGNAQNALPKQRLNPKVLATAYEF